MRVVAFVLVVLSLVLLGAHFFRYGTMLGVWAVIATIALLFVRKPWSARLVQVVLVAGALEWAHTLYTLVQVRLVQEESFGRLVLILGTVIAVTLVSAASFETTAMRSVFRKRGIWKRRATE